MLSLGITKNNNGLNHSLTIVPYPAQGKISGRNSQLLTLPWEHVSSVLVLGEIPNGTVSILFYFRVLTGPRILWMPSGTEDKRAEQLTAAWRTHSRQKLVYFGGFSVWGTGRIMEHEPSANFPGSFL
jgi:hypothetical protein